MPVRDADGGMREEGRETLLIQAAHPEDWPWMLSAHAQTAWDSLRPEHRAAVPLAHVQQKVAAQQAAMRGAQAHPHAALVARTPDGERAGFVLVEETQSGLTGERLAWVTLLYVAEAHRRRGVARRLLAAAERWASGLGLTRIGLSVAARNDAARALYEAEGYEVDLVRMAKEVGA